MEAEEITLAGVRAKLDSIIFTYLCKYIQCKVAGREYKTRTIERLVEFRLCKIRSIIGLLESEFVFFSIYIYKALCPSVRYVLFVPRGTNIFHTQVRGGDKQF